MIDPFAQGFTLTELTESINLLPNMYGRINQLGLFRTKSLTTDTAAIEMRNGVLALVPTAQRGGPVTKNRSGKRNLRKFDVPHTPLEDTLLASDVIGVRQFGSESAVETVENAVNDKLQDMKNKIDQTMEWRKMGALKGIVLDADGVTVIEDYYDAFDITPKVIDFSSGSMRNKSADVARHIEDNLLGEVMQRVHVLASAEWFDAFVEKADVKAAFANYAEAAQRLGGDMRKNFTYGSFTIEEYRASVDGKRFIEEGKAHAFPIGTSNAFANYVSPADFNETVNTRGLPYYARQQNKDFNRGVDLHAQANQLPMVARPSLLVELTI